MAVPTSTADVKFTIIGRQPELLKRLQSSETSSNNFAPSPSRSPSPEAPDHTTPESRSRLSLFEALGQHEPDTNFTSVAPALDERKPTPVHDTDLDRECSLRLQYPPTPSEQPSTIFATLSAIQSCISSLCLPNTSPALLLVQSAQKRSADALDLALRANNLAQESLNSAREAASAAQEALTAGNEAKASVTAVIKAVNDIGFAENGTGSSKTLEWKETFRSLQTDLKQLSQWIVDKQAAELAMNAEKASFIAEKRAFEERVSAYERKQREELLHKQAAEEAARKQREEELERLDEIAREEKRKRAERQQRNDLNKRKAEEQREEEATKAALLEQEKRRQEIVLMKARSQQEEAAKILANRAKNLDSHTSPPPSTSPEAGPLNKHSPAGQSIVTRSSETQKEDSVDNSAQRASGLSPRLACSPALALRDAEVAVTPPPHLSDSFPSRALSQSADERHPLAYCLSSDKGNLPIVDDDHDLLPHVQETNLFVVMQSHRVHSSNGAVTASSTPPRAPRSGPKAPTAQSSTLPSPNLAAPPPHQTAITSPPSSSHQLNGYAVPPITQIPKPASQSSRGPIQNGPLSVPTRSVPDVSKADPPVRLPLAPRSQVTRPQDVTRAVPPAATVASASGARAPRHTPPQSQLTKTIPNVMPTSVVPTAQKTSKNGGKARKKQAAARTTPAANILPHTRQPDSSRPASTPYRAPSPISPDMFGGWDRLHVQDEPQPQPRTLRTGTTKHQAAHERSPSRHYSPGYSSPPRAPEPYSPPPLTANSHRSPPQPVAGHKRLRDDEDYVQFPPAQRVRGDADYSLTTRPSHPYYRPADPFVSRSVDRARTPPRRQAEHPLPAGPSHPRQWQSNEKRVDLLGRISDHHKPKPRNTDSIPLTERMQGPKHMQDSLLTRIGR